jgi:ankyrin repeat protein
VQALAADLEGYTALHLVALKGDEDLLRQVVSRKADVNAPAKNGNTPLHCAVISGTSMDDPVCHCSNSVGSRIKALDLYASPVAGSDAAVRALLKRGANAFARNHDFLQSIDLARVLPNPLDASPRISLRLIIYERGCADDG